MNVLIKGMEMPESCFDCPFMYGRRYCRANSKIEFNDPDYSELKGRYDGCPLVPVPAHGRLIDADGEIGVNVAMMPGGKCRVDLIAPTVIPAEGET